MDNDPISTVLQYIGVGPETAGSIAGIATPALEGAALGAIGGAIGGDPGMGALAGGAAGGALGLGNQYFGSASTAAPGTASVGSGSAGSTGVAAPASVPFGSGDVTDSTSYSTSVSSGSGYDGGAILPGGSTSGARFDGGSTAPTGGTAGGAVGGSGASVTPVAPAAAAGGNSFIDAFKDPSLANITKAIGGNLGPLVSGGSFLASAMKGNTEYPGMGQIRSNAELLGKQGAELSSYLTSGTLPPAVQTSLNRAAEASKATIRSQYASRGMTGSDAEQRDLANVDSQMVSQGADVAMKLLSQGVQQTGMSSQLYNTIMQQAMQEDQALGDALTAFTRSMAPQPIQIGFGGVTR
jgi:hypothetical protein